MQNIDAVFEQNIGSQNLLPGLKDYREKFNKGALVFDARVAYAFKEELKLNVIVNNILNAEYVSRPGDIQPPRNFIVQLQVGF
jgi:iron complex outermembrane receptor protein